MAQNGSGGDAFDFVIVGAGTAASILAYRLGEAGHSVCVLEAGPPDRNPYIHIPGGFGKTLQDEKITWQLKSDPEPGIAGRSIVYAQGKTLGGSSSINGMVYNRGQAADFDGWAQLGNVGWSYDSVLPLFKRTERRVDQSVEPAYRGTDGRFTVITAKWPCTLETAFREAAVALGYPPNPDYNGEFQEGVGGYQSSIWKGRRVSAANAFLHPARKRFQVDVRCNALATCLQFDGRRVTGVAYRRRGRACAVTARREVIVSAGTLNSPKLLQLSGIGPEGLLAAHGIRVRHALPGVGENLRDHFGPRIVARAKPGVDSINLHVKGLPLAAQIVRWACRRPSILSVSPARAHAFGKSRPHLENPDYVLMFAPASFKAGLVGVLDDFPGLTIGTWPMRPQSVGYSHIASADPDDPPHFSARYLTAPEDGQVLLAAMKAARAVMATEPLAALIDQELFPGSDCRSDDELLDFARNSGATSFHLAGTCKMGPASDGNAVVDPRLRVHGRAGLRVADASIMPTLPSANTAAATMMIAEKAAEMIIKDVRQAV